MTPADAALFVQFPATGPRAGAAVQRAELLVVPAGTDLLSLALAWYPGAVWLVDPRDASVARAVRRSGGARFRGAPVEASTQVGRLALADGTTLEGPLRPGPDVPVLVGVPSEAYRLPLDGAASPWAHAAARHVGGGLTTGTGTPHPEASEVSLTRLVLFSPQQIDAATASARVRSVLPAAQVHAEQPTSTVFTIQHDLAYDGTLVVDARPAEGQMPAALRGLDWRSVGPHTTTVAWVPVDRDTARPLDSMDLLCLRRAAPWIARTMQALQTMLAGAVLDADGFLVEAGTLGSLGRAR